MNIFIGTTLLIIQKILVGAEARLVIGELRLS
jgi:hypothetical protein